MLADRVGFLWAGWCGLMLGYRYSYMFAKRCPDVTIWIGFFRVGLSALVINLIVV